MLSKWILTPKDIAEVTGLILFSFVKKYWLHILILIGSCAYFLWMTAPDMTWVNVDCDGALFLNSAQNIVLSHPTGSPLYNMVNYLIVRIPIESEFWRLSATSALCAGFTCWLLFVIGRRYTTSKMKALIAPLVYCASAIVVSQATILDEYSLITFLSVLAFFFHLQGRIRLKYIVLAIGLGIHHLIGFPLCFIFLADIVKRVKAKQKPVRPAMFIPLLGLLFYIWVFVVNDPPYNLITGEGVKDYVNYFFGQGGLIGGLALSSWNDVLRRMQDMVLMLGLSFGLSTIIIFPAIWRNFKAKGMASIDNKIIGLMYVLPILYYAIGKDPQCYTYTMPAFAFGGLLAVQGVEWLTCREKEKPLLDQIMEVIPTVIATGVVMGIATKFGLVKPMGRITKLKHKVKISWLSFKVAVSVAFKRSYRTRRAVAVAVYLCCVGLMIFNTQVFDIGNNLDRHLTEKKYYESLDELPDGTTIWSGDDTLYTLVIMYYNTEHPDRDINILPLFFTDDMNESVQVAHDSYNASNLWIADRSYTDDGIVTAENRQVTAETYQDDFATIESYTKYLAFNSSMIKTGWVNPVDLVSGKLVTTRWTALTKSNMNAGYMLMWIISGFFSNDITYVIWHRKTTNKKTLKNLNIITVAVIIGLLLLVCYLSGMDMIWMH